MKNSVSALIILALLACQGNKAGQSVSNDWIQLFNGKDMNDWRVKISGYPLGDNYGNTFRVEDRKLKVGYDEYRQFDEKFGHIFYKNKYAYCLLAGE